MIDSRPMTFFPLFAAASDPANWKGIATGAAGTGIVGTFLTFFFQRYTKRAEDAAKAAEKRTNDDATVATAKLASTDKLEEAYRREIHRLMGESNERILRLEARVVITEEKLEMMRAKYVHLYVYAERLQDRIQALLRVIKNDKPDFDDAHFRPIDLAPLAPDTLFVQPSTQVHITIPPADPKRTTAMISANPPKEL